MQKIDLKILNKQLSANVERILIKYKQILSCRFHRSEDIGALTKNVQLIKKELGM